MEAATHGHVGNNNQHLDSEYISTEAGKAISTEAGKAISTEAGKAISTEAGLLESRAMLATRFGVAATELADPGEFGRMVCLKGTTIQSVELAEAIGWMKAVDPKGEMVRMAEAIGICFGD